MTDTRKTHPALDALIEHIADNTTAPRAATWATDLNRARNVGAVVALKTWLANHDVVETIQVSYDGERLTRGWVPGPREVERRATFALFDGSRRDYAGLTCITSTDTVWAGWDGDTLVCYSVI